jgi:hypothetical protein
VASVTPRPRFTPGERTPVPIVLEAGWAPELVWTQRLEEKFFAGDRTLVVQSVVRHSLTELKREVISSSEISVKTAEIPRLYNPKDHEAKHTKPPQCAIVSILLST